MPKKITPSDLFEVEDTLKYIYPGIKILSIGSYESTITARIEFPRNFFGARPGMEITSCNFESHQIEFKISDFKKFR